MKKYGRPNVVSALETLIAIIIILISKDYHFAFYIRCLDIFVDFNSSYIISESS